MRAIGYARVSTKAQDKDGAYGLETQRQDIEKYCLLKGFQLVDTLTEDISGASRFTDRPMGQRVINAVESGMVNVVVMPRMDRFSRSEYLTDHMLFLELVDRNSVEWHMSDKGQITKDIASVITTTVDNYSASADRKDRADKGRKAKRSKAESGKHVGQGAPNYGYNKVYNPQTGKKDLAVNPQEAEVVRLIFQLYVDDGYTLRGISQYLADNKISPPAKTKRVAKMWGITTLRNLLKQTLYVGYYYYGKTKSVWVDDRKSKSRKVALPKSDWIRVDLPELRIVSDDVYNKAQTRLQTNKDIYKAMRDRVSYVYHLKDFMVCECGHGVTGYHPRARKPQYRLICQQGELKDANVCEREDSGVRTAVNLESEILSQVWSALHTPEFIKSKIDEYNASLQSKQGELFTRIQDLEKITEDLDNKVANLVNSLANIHSPDAVELIGKQIDQFTQESKQAQIERDNLLEQTQSPINDFDFAPGYDIFTRATAIPLSVPMDTPGEQVDMVEVFTDMMRDNEVDPVKVRQLYRQIGLQVTWKLDGEYSIEFFVDVCNPSKTAPW